MPVAELRSVSLAFGHWPLLTVADLVLERGERAALIGRNGEGKSSLLRILAGAVAPDDGEAWVEPGARVVLVPQEPEFSEDLSVYDAIAEQHVRRGADDEAWQVAHRVEKQIALLGLDRGARVGTLSGGMKKRVALAGALVNEPDLLLLDEPTNHLDIAGIEWLERVLLGQRGAVLVVSHDRRFLENVSTRILELERGRLSSYPNRFSEYLERKAIQLNDEAVRNQKFDKLLAQEEVWIRKGVEARRTRNEGRVRRLEALRRERAARRERIGNASLAIDPGNRSGKLVADLDGISKRFDGKPVVTGFSAVIQRGDHIGLIGPNGIGKTTLIRMILGEIEPDSGQIRRGTKLDVAYFDQFRAALDPEATLADVISQGSDFVEIGTARKHVISYLEDFLFPPERSRAKVKSLSGGERNRLLLARLFSRPANLLVLDEPTNDLDIETLELLEALLQEYAGTLLVVSHDRTFLNNVVTQTFVFEGAGLVREYAGGYDDWISQRAAGVARGAVDAVRDQPASQSRRGAERKARMSFKELRDLEEIPSRIDALEKEQAAITARLADTAVYVDAPEEVKALAGRLDQIALALDEHFARWETLEAKRDTSVDQENPAT